MANSSKNKKNSKKNPRNWALYILIIAVFALFFSVTRFGNGSGEVVELTTSEFITAVEQGQVKEVTYVASSGVLEGTLNSGATLASTAASQTEEAQGESETSGAEATTSEAAATGESAATSESAESAESADTEKATESADAAATTDETSGETSSDKAQNQTQNSGVLSILGMGSNKQTEDKDDTSNEGKDFTSTFVGSDALIELMSKHPEVQFSIDVKSSSIWMSLLTSFLPILLLLGVFIFFMSQMNGANNKQMQFGKTKAKKEGEQRPTTKFSDVAGIDEVVIELEEVRDFLAEPEKYRKLGAKVPRGVLLVGPPGCGKTLLAKAVAGEAGVPFFSISGSDFVEMFVGVGASRVRDLFEQARDAAPSIIFIDEIDAVGRQRGAGLGGGHDEREQTLNQLLVEMDGFEDHESVILIAATNRVDILDPALLRPGRFDRQITVQPPDLKGREAILTVHSANKPFSKHVDMLKVAKLTPGFSGADLANLCNEAALLTARRNKSIITMDEVDEAMERIIAGPERKGRVMTDTEKTTIAYHESGHALVGHLLEHADPVHKISIIARGMALGYTLSLPEEDRFLKSRNEMTDELAMFLGGRVAEEVACGDITTGASNDLERATKMAKEMVTRYGMTEALGTQVYGEPNHNPFLGRDYSSTPDYSEATAMRIDEEVSRIMKSAHDVAYRILTENRAQLDLMAQVLLERETVEGEAVDALLNNTWDDYLEHEEEILARRSEEQKKLDAEDEAQLAESQALAGKAANAAAGHHKGHKGGLILAPEDAEVVEAAEAVEAAEPAEPTEPAEAVETAEPTAAAEAVEQEETPKED